MVSDAKSALQNAARVQMELGPVDVRQISVAPRRNSPHKLATVVTRSSQEEENPLYSLILVDFGNAAVLKREDQITSAVFSADGSHIVAGRDSNDENIVVFDL